MAGGRLVITNSWSCRDMAIYLALNAALLRARDRLLDLVDRADAFPHLLRVIFWALLAVATAAALLDHGAWTRKNHFQARFVYQTNGLSATL